MKVSFPHKNRKNFSKPKPLPKGRKKLARLEAVSKQL
jgi:hypothetical protein